MKININETRYQVQAALHLDMADHHKDLLKDHRVAQHLMLTLLSSHKGLLISIPVSIHLVLLVPLTVHHTGHLTVLPMVLLMVHHMDNPMDRHMYHRMVTGHRAHR